MEICSKEKGLCIKSSFPKFKYRFPEINVPVEVEDAHVEKILKNPTFYIAGKEDVKIKEKTWEEKLIEINGIGEKTAKDIISLYPDKKSLSEAIRSEKELPWDEDVVKKLEETFK